MKKVTENREKFKIEDMMIPLRQTSRLLAAGVFCLSLCLGSSAFAGTIPTPTPSPGGPASPTGLPTATPMTPTCNADVMLAVETRAWLAAQKEIEINQALIAKPDSILEMTCFDGFLGVLAQHASQMFSENTSPWSGGVGKGQGGSTMDNALSGLVGAPTAAYTSANFNHNVLGGRGTAKTPFNGSISGASYTCSEMDRIWKEAKCYNFATLDTDGFLSYKQHESTVVRTLPTPCTPKDTRYASHIEQAFDLPDWKTVPSGTPPLSYNAGMSTGFNTFTEYNTPGSCSSARAVKTGVEFLDRASGSNMTDTVCSNPGCYYDGSSCTSM